jgi:hypothetical protein
MWVCLMSVKCNADSQIHHLLLPALLHVPCHSVCDSLNISFWWKCIPPPPSTVSTPPPTWLLSFSSWWIESSSDTESLGLANKLNFWNPSSEMLPHFAGWHSRFRDRGLVARFPAADTDFFLVSVNYPDEIQTCTAKRVRFWVLMWRLQSSWM